MSKTTPRTSGLEWLIHSMNAFNGSGYADKATPENFVESYRAYNLWRKRDYAIGLVDEYPEQAFEAAVRLCSARDAGHTPTLKNLAKFSRYYNPDKVRMYQ